MLETTKNLNLNIDKDFRSPSGNEKEIELLKKQIAFLNDEKATLYIENENLRTSLRDMELNFIRYKKTKIERK
jgi:regulator of replication initiation timing